MGTRVCIAVRTLDSMSIGSTLCKISAPYPVPAISSIVCCVCTGCMLCCIPAERPRQPTLRAGHEPSRRVLPAAVPPLPGTDCLHHNRLVHALAARGSPGGQPAVPGGRGPGCTASGQGSCDADVRRHSHKRKRGVRTLLYGPAPQVPLLAHFLMHTRMLSARHAHCKELVFLHYFASLEQALHHAAVLPGPHRAVQVAAEGAALCDWGSARAATEWAEEAQRDQ